MNKKEKLRETTKYALFSSALIFGSILSTQATAATSGTDTDTGPRGPIGSAMHYVAHNSFVSIGGLHMQYLGNSTDLTQNVPAFGLSQTVPNSGSSQSSTTTAEITYGLYLPRTDHHLALQFQLTPPLDFNFEGNTGSGYQKVGTFRALPPNFTFVYRPWVSTRIRPFVGVGATWLNTYDTQVTDPTYKALDAHLSLSEPVAFIGEVGADINLWSRLFLNLDFRYIGLADVKSKLSIPANAAAGVPATTIRSTNHWKAALYTVGLGWRF